MRNLSKFKMIVRHFCGGSCVPMVLCRNTRTLTYKSPMMKLVYNSKL